MTKANCMSVMLSLVLGVFSCAALAGNSAPVSASGTTIVALTQDEALQASGQDPSSPPDCKKYPKDTRCKK